MRLYKHLIPLEVDSGGKMIKHVGYWEEGWHLHIATAWLNRAFDLLWGIFFSHFWLSHGIILIRD